MPTLKERLATSEFLLGSYVFSTDAAIPEIYAGAGFDFVIIDMEHGPNDFATTLGHLRSARGAGISAVVRVGKADVGNVARLLDAGAESILLPHYGGLGTVAAEALREMKYYPEGNRPTCTGVRATQYGLSDFASYASRNNVDLVRMGLIEDRECIERIDELLALGEVDWVTPGPADLATSLGFAGQLKHPDVEAAITRLVEAAERNRIPFGMYIHGPQDIPAWRRRGARFFILRIDLLWLAQSLREAAQACRNAR